MSKPSKTLFRESMTPDGLELAWDDPPALSVGQNVAMLVSAALMYGVAYAVTVWEHQPLGPLLRSSVFFVVFALFPIWNLVRSRRRMTPGARPRNRVTVSNERWRFAIGRRCSDYTPSEFVKVISKSQRAPYSSSYDTSYAVIGVGPDGKEVVLLEFLTAQIATAVSRVLKKGLIERTVTDGLRVCFNLDGLREVVTADWSDGEGVELAIDEFEVELNAMLDRRGFPDAKIDADGLAEDLTVFGSQTYLPREGRFE